MISIVVVLSWLALPGRAQEQPAQPTLAGLVELARQRNPDVVAASKRWEMAQAKIAWDQAWPDPQISSEYCIYPRSGQNPWANAEKCLCRCDFPVAVCLELDSACPNRPSNLQMLSERIKEALGDVPGAARKMRS